MVKMDNTIEWIGRYVDDNAEYDDNIKVSIHTGKRNVWIAEITESGYPLMSFDGNHSMCGFGDTIEEALNDLNSRCGVDVG